MARPKNSEKREIYYIVKHSVMEFSLMKLTIEGNEVISDEKIHKDIPAIVYGKLFQKLKQEKVG